jgi:hypothetical protein
MLKIPKLLAENRNIQEDKPATSGGQQLNMFEV